MNSSLPFKRHFRITGGMWDLHTRQNVVLGV